MVLNTLTVGAAVTPQVIGTAISHYIKRKPRRGKPTAHISYDQGLHLVRQFLDYSSRHTVEEVQAFTAQWVPCPTWVKTVSITISIDHLDRAAAILQAQLGPSGLRAVGGSKWWQWRPDSVPLRAEWIEMRADYHARIASEAPARRIMLYIHGGAYYFGSVDEHRYQLQRHARKLKARLLAPRYRLAPQFPFPCGLQDAIAAYLFLIADHDPKTVLLAGDSAGAGMVLSLMVTLRDQGIPLPAGAVLISPWVDLTHSFPSVSGDGPLDYIPSYGFHHKPSVAWPPPNDAELKELYRNRGQDSQDRPVQSDTTGVKSQATTAHSPANSALPNNTHQPPTNLSLDLDGKHIELEDQIQLYAPNHLLTHPLVSPVMQPSLGGLPPLLIQTGGGELLCDEQIYLAHKAANPLSYMCPDVISDAFDKDGQLLHKYPPTQVQLQVWDDLCHVPHTLSFTRPAKYMYRGVAQFGNWCYAHAIGAAADMEMDSDALSVMSSDSSASDSETETKTTRLTARARMSTPGEHIATSNVAGDTSVSPKIPTEQANLGTVSATEPLPAFRNHMIRQRVDRHGSIFDLAQPADLPGCAHPKESIGVIKPGPVRKWLARRKVWDKKFAGQKHKVQSRRAKEISKGYEKYIDEDGTIEIPPPTALAGRRLVKKDHADEEALPNLSSAPNDGKKRSWGLAMWSGWGSKHDSVTVEATEGEAKQIETPDRTQSPASGYAQPSTTRAEDRSDVAQTATAAAALPRGQKVEGSEQTYIASTSTRPHNGVVAYPFKLHEAIAGQRSASTLTLQSQADEPARAVSPMQDKASPLQVGGGTDQRPKLDTFVTAREGLATGKSD